MTALPPINEVNLKLNLDHHSTAISLYRLVLQAETAALEANQTTNLIHSRILGYLILFPVGDQARAYVLKEIASCDSKHASVQSLNDALYILGGHYCDFLIRLCEFICHRPSLPKTLTLTQSIVQGGELRPRQDTYHVPHSIIGWRR